ncbi:MAG: tetratricopeptide repeat protein [Terracidiphilus sp.]
MTKESGPTSYHLELTREPITLALLFGAAVLFFLFVAGLSRMYHVQRNTLASRWSGRGASALQAGRFEDAVADYRTALLYSRNDYSCQLHLAEALMGEKRTDEAYAYLINLWSRQPENGIVNLQLARIAAARGNTEKALRYYHNAIYATWPGDQEPQRRRARLELIHYLLGIGDSVAAQSELIALAANLGSDPAEQARVGGLFLAAQDARQALAEYRLSLRGGLHDPAVLAGAGRAAYDLGQYELAEHYLAEAVRAAPGDTASAALLETSELVLRLNPFRSQIRAAERDRTVIEDFAAAGARIDSCCPAGAVCAPSQQALDQQWKKMKPQITLAGLRRNPDLIDPAMDLVFDIERQSGGTCGVLTETDTALLLIAKSHEGL